MRRSQRSPLASSSELNFFAYPPKSTSALQIESPRSVLVRADRDCLLVARRLRPRDFILHLVNRGCRRREKDLGIGISIGANSLGTGSLNDINRRLGRSFEKLASGSRIPRASADAAGLAISETLRALTASLQQGVRNLNDGISATRIAEGALEEDSNVLIRLRELSVQSQNGTLNDGQRAIIQQEFEQLTEQITSTSTNASFNDQNLLDGTADIAIVDGSSGASTSIQIGDQSASALGVQGLDASDPASLAAIDQAISSVASARAQIGATENRLESQARSRGVEIENTIRANSQIRDTDFAKESSELLRNQILKQANISLRAQANVGANVALRLLA